ncbi:MAG: hypothetical protein M1812_005689 [Candelaria pacifica]|nr:MAG: hypothetical protein M1812_005689 [Candelaria pacifica]
MTSQTKIPDGFLNHLNKLGFFAHAGRIRHRFYDDLRTFHDDPLFPDRKSLNTKTDEKALNREVWIFLEEHGQQFFGPDSQFHRKSDAAVWDPEDKEKAEELHTRARSAFLYLTANFLRRERSQNQPSRKRPSKRAQSSEDMLSDDDFSNYPNSSTSSTEELELETRALPSRNRPSRNRKLTWYLRWMPEDQNEAYPVIHREATTTRTECWYVRINHEVHLKIVRRSARSEGGTNWVLEDDRLERQVRVIKKPAPSNSGHPVEEDFSGRSLREEVSGNRNGAALVAYPAAGQHDGDTIQVGSLVAQAGKTRAIAEAAPIAQKGENINEPSSRSWSKKNTASANSLGNYFERIDSNKSHGQYIDPKEVDNYANVLMVAAGHAQLTPINKSSMPPPSSNTTAYKKTPTRATAETGTASRTTINDLPSAGEKLSTPVYRPASMKPTIESSQSTKCEGHDAVEEWNMTAYATSEDGPVTRTKRSRSSMEAPFLESARVNKTARLDSSENYHDNSGRSLTAFDEVDSESTFFRGDTPLTTKSPNVIGRPPPSASEILPRTAGNIGSNVIFRRSTLPSTTNRQPSLSVSSILPREASKIKAKIRMQSQSASVTKILPAALNSETFSDIVHKAWRLNKDDKKFDYIDASLGNDASKERVWLDDEECFDVLMDTIRAAMADGKSRCELEVTIPL